MHGPFAAGIRWHSWRADRWEDTEWQRHDRRVNSFNFTRGSFFINLTALHHVISHNSWQQLLASVSAPIGSDRCVPSTSYWFKFKLACDEAKQQHSDPSSWKNKGATSIIQLKPWGSLIFLKNKKEKRKTERKQAKIDVKQRRQLSELLLHQHSLPLSVVSMQQHRFARPKPLMLWGPCHRIKGPQLFPIQRWGIKQHICATNPVYNRESMSFAGHVATYYIFHATQRNLLSKEQKSLWRHL